MNGFFNINNGIFHALSKFVDCVYLSVLFLISCIPVFTIGAAMTALYYTVQKVLKNERGYVGREYWHSFKSNFKQGTIIWLIVLGISAVLGFDIWYLWALNEVGNPLGKAYIFFGAILILVMTWCAYLFPYLARFVNGTKVIMKNAAYMAVLNLPWTLLLILNMVVMGLIAYIIPITIVIVPVAYTWIQSLILEKVFRKYMSEEDKAAEDEMNQEYKN